MKKCVHCKYEYPLEEFPILEVSYDGHNSYCNGCFLQLSQQERPTPDFDLSRLIGAIVVEKNTERTQSRNREKALRYLARKAKADGDFSKEDIEKIYASQDGRCAYCGTELNGKFHIDHIHPLSRGGSNWPNNLACACAKCNTSKRDKTVAEWRSRP